MNGADTPFGARLPSSNLCWSFMNRVLALVLMLAIVSTGVAVSVTGYQRGVVVRMRMGDCGPARHGFISTFGPPQAAAEEACPEYTLVSDKVVFLIVGRSSKEFVPLAETVDFRFQKSELFIRVNDERKESRFEIKEMTLRSQWDMVQQHIEQQLKDRHDAESGSPAPEN
jgi:hypothetical protein